jgi:hypothetical protein
MTYAKKDFEYDGYRITVVHENDGYVAYTERLGHIVSGGLGKGKMAGTAHYAQQEEALAAAKSAIDKKDIT